MKKIICILISVLLALCFFGCSKADGEEETTVVNTKVEYPLSVTDHTGRTVEIKKEPKKIVCVDHASTVMLVALDQGDKLVGIESNAADYNIYKKCDKGLLKLSGVGSNTEFSVEKCKELSPDLVIIPNELKDEISKIEGNGAVVVVLNTKSNQQISDALDILSQLTNSIERANKLNNFISEKMNEMKSATAGDTISVYLTGNSSVLKTPSKDAFLQSIVNEANLSNCEKALIGNIWIKRTYQQINASNPEYIIIASDAEFDENAVLNDEKLLGVSAVQNQKVFKMPSDIENWDSPSVSSFLGSLWAASVTHEAYSKEEFTEAANDYYKEFFGFNAGIK